MLLQLGDAIELIPILQICRSANPAAPGAGAGAEGSFNNVVLNPPWINVSLILSSTFLYRSGWFFPAADADPLVENSSSLSSSKSLSPVWTAFCSSPESISVVSADSRALADILVVRSNCSQNGIWLGVSAGSVVDPALLTREEIAIIVTQKTFEIS